MVLCGQKRLVLDHIGAGVGREAITLMKILIVGSNVMQDGGCTQLSLLFSPDFFVSGLFRAWLKLEFRRDKVTVKMDVVFCQGGCLEEGLTSLLCLWSWWLRGVLPLPHGPLPQSWTAAAHSACSVLGLGHQEQNQTGKSARNLSVSFFFFFYVWHSSVNLDP